MSGVKVIIETGKKKMFASALEWPGWSRIGANEKAALEALAVYGQRYQRAIKSSSIRFLPPPDISEFNIVERIAGGKTTDFGVPIATATAEAIPLGTAELKNKEALLKSTWEYFNEVINANAGRSLRKGPRGGGRTLEQIIDHVLDAHAQAYLPKINWRENIKREKDAGLMIKTLEDTDHDALALSRQIPTDGPRGGKLWTRRYFIRRAAWHILDHAWEIEDRSES